MNYRLLIVEGETAAVWTLTQKLALERTDLIFESFADSQKALERFQQQRPDLLITDLKIRSLNSPVLLQQTRELEPDLPVLVVASTPEPELQAQALQYGITELFEKPIDLKKFLETVNRVLPAQTPSSWHDLLTESYYLAETPTRSETWNFEVAAPSETPVAKLFDSATKRPLPASNNAPSAALQPPTGKLVTTPQNNVAVPYPELTTQTAPKLQSSSTLSDPLFPDPPTLPAEQLATLSGLCATLFKQVTGSLICAVADLSARVLIACAADTPQAVSSERLLKLALEIFQSERLQLTIEENLAAESAGPLTKPQLGPEEIQLSFYNYVLFGKTSPQRRLAFMLVTNQDVNIGYCWYHLKAAVATLET